jgi:hypothetical protein
MDNLKLPAYPQMDWHQTEDGRIVYQTIGGFSKLEKASLMIASGIANIWGLRTDQDTSDIIAEVSVRIAEAVLEKANK